MMKIVKGCRCVVLLVAALAVPAWAADEPKKVTVDMTARVLDFNSKPIKDVFEINPKEDPTCEKCPELTLGSAIWWAVNRVLQDDNGVQPATRQAWVQLAGRIQHDPAAVLTPKERDALIDRVGKVYSQLQPVVAVRAPMMIDPNWSVPELK